MALTRTVLRQQVERIHGNGLLALLKAAAEKHDLPLAYVVAIASRETNCRHILGDFGHGVGIIQIDVRSHEIARRMKADGTWKTKPEALIDYGVRLLRGNFDWARANWPTYTPEQHRKLAAAAYNAGRGGCRRGADEGDCDRYTTGKDYGRDVLARAKTLEGTL